MLEKVKAQMPDVVYRRARHCVGEDQRTLAAVQALKDKDYKKVGTYDLSVLFDKFRTFCL